MATRNIVPRANNEGMLGTEEKKWSSVNATNMNASNIKATTVDTESITADTADVDSAEIKTLTSNGTEIKFSVLRRNTSYEIGDVVYDKNLPSYIRLECYQAGTTAQTEPDELKSVDTGVYVTDGSTKWIACDIKDGLSLGDVTYRPILKEGYVKLNGATVQREDYPRLVQYATDNNLWTSSPSTEVWKFGQGDGGTTFVLPDYRNLFIEGADTPSKVEAGMPNIQGSFYASDTSSLFWTGAKKASGAFSLATDNKSVFTGGTVATYPTITTVTFKASASNAIYGKSTTVQPPAIKLIPQIKY